MTMLTKQMRQEDMPLTPYIQFNNDIIPYIKRIRDAVSENHNRLAKETLIVPGYQLSDVDVLSAAIERFYQDIINQQHLTGLSKYEKMYENEDYQGKKTNFRVHQSALGRLKQIAKLMEVKHPEIDIYWRERISTKKLGSIIIYYIDDTY